MVDNSGNTVWVRGSGKYVFPVSREILSTLGVTMQKIVRDSDIHFCHNQWDSVWNSEPLLSTAHVTGHTLWMGTVMGLMIIDMDEFGSVEAFCSQLRGAADQAEAIHNQYKKDGYVPTKLVSWYGHDNTEDKNESDTPAGDKAQSGSL